MITPESATPYRSEAHRALAERELIITEANLALGQEAVFRAIAQDRKERWAALLADREESADIRTWASNMTKLHGATVRIHRTRLDWITALYVTRYGEAEDFWPTQLGPDDVVKALRWYRGERRPDGVVYEREEL